MMHQSDNTLIVRPHELVALIARLGAGRDWEDLGDQRLTAILQAIRDNPRRRLRFRGYAGVQYSGCDDDAPQGVAQTMLWDMEILYRMFRKQSEARFVVEPVITGYAALQLLISKLPSIEGVCVHAPRGPAWGGMPGVTDGDYARGRARVRDWLARLLPAHNAGRTAAELAGIRREFAARIYSADCLRLFPQHLLFVIAYYGRCAEMLRGEVFEGDCMYEVGVAMRRRPDMPVMLVPEYCMLCPTCRAYDPEGIGSCGVVPGDLKPAENAMAGLVALNLLRTLGLDFYQKLPAAEMVQLAFDRLALDHVSFTYQGAPPAAWAYARGQYAGVGFLDAYRDAPGVIARVRHLLKHPDVLAVLPAADQNHMHATLAKAENAPDERGRYLALTDEPFSMLWKFQCEKAAQHFARLPDAIRRGRAERDGRPVCRIAPAGPDADSLEKAAGQWNTGEYSAGFLTIGNRPAIAETAVKAVLIRDRLYITVLCAERDPAAIKTGIRVGTELLEYQRWSKHFARLDDSVAVMLCPENDLQTVYQFAFTARGVKAGRILRFGPGRHADDAWIYETDWRVATGAADGMWRGTAEIPLACMAAGRPPAGGWRMNVIRFYRNESLFPHAWSALQRDAAALDKHMYATSQYGYLEKP